MLIFQRAQEKKRNQVVDNYLYFTSENRIHHLSFIIFISLIHCSKREEKNDLVPIQISLSYSNFNANLVFLKEISITY